MKSSVDALNSYYLLKKEILLDFFKEVCYNYNMIKNLFLSFLLFFLTSVALAEPQIRFSQEGCVSTARVLGMVAVERDAGIPIENQFKELAGVPMQDEVKLFIAKQVVKVYNMYKSLSPQEVAELFLKQCFAAQGDLKKMDYEIKT